MAERPFWLRNFEKGLIKDVPADGLPDDALSEAVNIVVKKGLIKKAPGYAAIIENATAVPGSALNLKALPGTPKLLYDAKFYSGARHMVACTTTDILRFDAIANEWVLLTPLYIVDSVDKIDDDTPDATHFTVTGSGATLWDTISTTGRQPKKNVAVGDYFRLNAWANGVWRKVSAVTNDNVIVCEGTPPTAPVTPAAAAYTIRQCFQGTIYQRWRADQLGEQVAFVNDADRVQSWNGTAAAVSALPGLLGVAGDPDVLTAKDIVAVSGKLMIAGLTETGSPTDFPNRIRWSDRGDGEEWLPGSATEAGFLDLLESSDVFMSLERLRESVILYKNNRIIRLTDEGSPLFFTPTTIAPSLGLRAQGLVAPFRDFQLFWSDKGFYILDGVSVQPIHYKEGEWAVKEYFLDNLHPEHADTAFTLIDQDGGYARFVYPTTSTEDGLPDEELVYDVNRKNWSVWRRGAGANSIAASGYGSLQATTRVWDRYLTHRTGTIDIQVATPTIVTGTGTLWLSEPLIRGRRNAGGEPDDADEFANTGCFFRAEAAGDSFGLPGEAAATWIRIRSVDSDTQITLESAYPNSYAGGGEAYAIGLYFWNELPSEVWDARESFIKNLGFFHLLGDGRLAREGDYSLDGADYEAWVETKETDFGAPEGIKTINAIYLDCANIPITGTKLQIQVARRNNKESPYAWSPSYLYPLDGSGKGHVALVLSARYFKFRFGRSGKNDPWVLRGIGFDVDVTARHFEQITAGSPLAGALTPEAAIQSPPGEIIIKIDPPDLGGGVGSP